MKKEQIAIGKTVDAAVEKGAAALGVPVSSVTYEILQEPKRGFLGFGEMPAKVKVVFELLPLDMAVSFVKTMLDDMEIKAEVTASDTVEEEGHACIDIRGGDSALLIGHHGDTLDQLQLLVNLVANKKGENGDGNAYTRVLVDVEGYRAKREQTLRSLARRTAARVLKYRRSVTLEPMSAYERRIIHSEVQGIAGVSTNSIGQDSNRRVVVYLDNNG